MGTWCMGESSDQRQREVAALRHGIDLGILSTEEKSGATDAVAVGC
jgi:hypothetical protein